uniref:sorting nexin-13-like n=1 Tax=Myxine glutinosa TaxID=7769 RepID=UPI00358F8E18
MKPEEKAPKWDRRLTGSSSIDDPLQQVLQFALRDYVQCWYYELSDEESFLTEIRQIAQRALVTLSNRCKDVDWQPYLTTRLVDDFASHLRVYRKALHKLEEEEDNEVEEEEDEEEPEPQHKSVLEKIVGAFFDVEVELEKEICRDMVCTSDDDEREFLRDLCEVLLFLLLPDDDFQSRGLRYIAREILVSGILLPAIETLADPDYINQYVIWMGGGGCDGISQSHFPADVSYAYEAQNDSVALRVSKLPQIPSKTNESSPQYRLVQFAVSVFPKETGMANWHSRIFIDIRGICLAISGIIAHIHGICLAISGIFIDIRGICLSISGIIVNIRGLPSTFSGFASPFVDFCLAIR